MDPYFFKWTFPTGMLGWITCVWKYWSLWLQGGPVVSSLIYLPPYSTQVSFTMCTTMHTGLWNKSKLLSSALLISFFAHTVLGIWNILWTLLYLAILIYPPRIHSRTICFRKPSWKFKFRPMGHLLCLPAKPLAMSILFPDHSPYYQEVVWFCMCRLSQPASPFKTTFII